MGETVKDFMTRRRRPSELKKLEAVIVRYFVKRCGAPEEEVRPQVEDSLAIYANVGGDRCILVFDAGGREPPYLIGPGSLPVEDMLFALEYAIRGAGFVTLASYVNERGVPYIPFKWRGQWEGREADKALSFFVGQAYALENGDSGPPLSELFGFGEEEAIPNRVLARLLQRLQEGA